MVYVGILSNSVTLEKSLNLSELQFLFKVGKILIIALLHKVVLKYLAWLLAYKHNMNIKCSMNVRSYYYLHKIFVGII